MKPDRPKPIRVVEVHPRWKTVLVVAAAAFGLLGTGLGIYGTWIQDDAVERLTPIAKSAEHLNAVVDRTGRIGDRIRELGRRTRAAACPPETPSCVAPDTDPNRRIVELGPFTVDRRDDPEVDGDWSVEFRFGD
jgi:hypothetical protein